MPQPRDVPEVLSSEVGAFQLRLWIGRTVMYALVSSGAADRARIRTQVAREFFAAEHGRAPIDAQELAGQIAKS